MTVPHAATSAHVHVRSPSTLRLHVGRTARGVRAPICHGKPAEGMALSSRRALCTAVPVEQLRNQGHEKRVEVEHDGGARGRGPAEAHQLKREAL